MKKVACVAALGIAFFAGCGNEVGKSPYQDHKKIEVDMKNDDLFDFRGIKLGVTRPEFKKIDPPVVASANAKLKPITTCSNDPESRGYRDNKNINAIDNSRCWWEYDTGDRKGKKPWERYEHARIAISSHEDDMYLFEFVAIPGDAQQRLYSITVHFKSKDWVDVLSAMEKKFGKATTGRQRFILDSGMELYSDTYSWDRKSSAAYMIKRVGQHDVGYVMYTLNSHSMYVYENTNKNGEDPKSKM